MKSSMEAFEAKIKDLLAVAPTPEDYENLVEFKELIELGWRLCDQYHEEKSKILVEVLEKLSGYVPYNGDTWVKERASEALKKYRGEI
jgi:hypothetical protein